MTYLSVFWRSHSRKRIWMRELPIRRNCFPFWRKGLLPGGQKDTEPGGKDTGIIIYGKIREIRSKDDVDARFKTPTGKSKAVLERRGKRWHNKQELWDEAKRKCRLGDEEIRMAREMWLNPKSLIKNIPNKKEMWKAPVKDWIHDMYEDRQRRSEQKAKRKKQNHR